MLDENNQISHRPIKSFVIVGGGTAGWISASILSRALRHTPHTITLIESPDIPTIGVGEATIPSFVDMLEYLQIPLQDFVLKTNATFKLGIKFTNWRTTEDHYWHQFGEIGNKIDGIPFYQHWLKHSLEHEKFALTDFSPAIALAKQNKFFIPSPKQPTNLSKSTFALHFDASKLAAYLEQYCIEKGVKHIKANVSEAHCNKDGCIHNLDLENQQQVKGDFFIDCSGQRALLIEKTMRIGYQNWQHYLPVDRAIAVQSEVLNPLPPYTESIAHEHGWRWRIPLQNRTGNGYVYCSDYCNDDQARELLEKNVDNMITQPRVLKFTTGVRNKVWHKNCLAVGLSSGFLEPLESTSIYLVMRTMLNFVQRLPTLPIQQPTVDEFNRKIINEYEYIRDFIVLHYCATKRVDSPFWRMWQHNEIPASLQKKMALFSCQGHLMDNHYDLFSHESWYAVLEGMGVRPDSFDPLVNGSDQGLISESMDKSAAALIHSVNQCLDHNEYIEKLIAHR